MRIMALRKPVRLLVLVGCLLATWAPAALAQPVPGTAPAAQPSVAPPAFAAPTIMCMNRNPPAGVVITRSLADPICNGLCRARVEAPQGTRMVICRGQPIPPGYSLELLLSTPDCSCMGSGDNAYAIRRQTEEGEP